VENTLFENITITNPTTYGVQIKEGALGSTTFRNVTVQTDNPDVPAIENQSADFTVIGEVISSGIERKPDVASSTAAFCVSRKRIDFTVPASIYGNSSRYIRLSLKSPDGREKTLLVEGDFPPGHHNIYLDGDAVEVVYRADGIHILLMEVDGLYAAKSISF
jgi:hypothetical protein